MRVPPERDLRGYSLPLSPSGGSAMVPDPPWHFSGDALWITYRADPAAVAAFLPGGLTCGSDPGAAALGFYDWQWCTDSGDELRDPGQAQFKECLIVLACQLDGEPVGRVPYAWVDSAVPLVRGLIQGMPKLFGTVWLTRAFPIGRAAPRRAAGGEFSATASAGGRRLFSATVAVERPATEPPPLADRPLVHTRHLPAWHPGEAPLAELVRADTSATAFADVWQGPARLEFHDVTDPDLATLAPVEVGTGYVFSYAETLAPGSRVGTRPRDAGQTAAPADRHDAR